MKICSVVDRFSLQAACDGGILRREERMIIDITFDDGPSLYLGYEGVSKFHMLFLLVYHLFLPWCCIFLQLARVWFRERIL